MSTKTPKRVVAESGAVGKSPDETGKLPRADTTFRWGALAAASFAAVHLLVSLFGVTPGYLLIDEVLYHWMARDFAASGTVELWTGYTEFPSVELFHVAHMRLEGGKVFAQYPDFFSVLSFPFFQALGFRGLFLVNALAFLGVLALCGALARRLFPERRLGLLAGAIFVVATFSWEYSQHAWPHMLAILFSTGAVFLAVRAYDTPSRRNAVVLAAAAGLVAGTGAGVRLDACLAIPCVVLPFVFPRPARWREAAAAVAGAVPPLAVLSTLNVTKFGTWNPFSYGTAVSGPGIRPPIALLFLGAGGLALAWVLTREGTGSLFGRRRPAIRGAILLVLLGALLVATPVREILQRDARTLYTHLVDIRTLPSQTAMPAMSRSAGGGVIYLGAHKKALLQSLPYLVLVLLPIARAVRRREDRDRILFLVQLPLLEVLLCAALAAFNFHGGLGLNMRYFLPTLPFTTILVAWALDDVRRTIGAGLSFSTLAVLAFLSAALFLAGTGPLGRTLEEQERFVLTIPLVLSTTLLVLVACRALPGPAGKRVARGLIAVSVLSLTWSGMAAFTYDLPRHMRQRAGNEAVGRLVGELVPADSLFVTAPYIDPFMKLIEKPRVRIALPAQDDFKDLPRLVRFHLTAGRRAFGVFRLSQWAILERGALSPYRIVPVWSFLESFENGPTLLSLGPYDAVPVRSPDRGFVLAEIADGGRGAR